MYYHYFFITFFVHKFHFRLLLIAIGLVAIANIANTVVRGRTACMGNLEMTMLFF